MQSPVTVSDVSFELPNGRSLFQHLHFSLDTKLTALVGPNGVGKTTLARIISGEIEPSTGSISGRFPIRFFQQREKPEEIPVHEYLSERYTWSLLGEQLLAGIDRDKFCHQLSGGQWMRVRLARTIDDQFLILDEPTNDLDREGRKALMNFLCQYQHGVLLISHDRECLNLCENILELSNQGLSKYGGGWSAYEKAKEHERHHSEVALEKAKHERSEAEAQRIAMLERQEKRNRKGKEAAKKGGIPRILLGARKQNAEGTTGKMNSQTLDKAYEKITAAYEAYQEMKVDPVMYADLAGEPIPGQKLVAQAQDFNIHFDDWIYPADLNFSWRGNVRMAIKGDNGSGKSTLIKALTGHTFKTRGELKLGNLRTLYLDQQCSLLNDNKSVFENVRAHSNLDDKEIRNGLAKFLFFGDSVFQAGHSLSGGERLRAALASGLLGHEKPELLILDEPTNNLDLVNINFLEDLVSHFKGALIIVSHDELFLEACRIEEEMILTKH